MATSGSQCITPETFQLGDKTGRGRRRYFLQSGGADPRVDLRTSGLRPRFLHKFWKECRDTEAVETLLFDHTRDLLKPKASERNTVNKSKQKQKHCPASDHSSRETRNHFIHVSERQLSWSIRGLTPASCGLKAVRIE